MLTFYCVFFPMYALLNDRKTEWPWLRLAFIFLLLSIAPCVIGFSRYTLERNQESFNAWVKHTKNPNNLTMHEWQTFNRN